MGQGHTECEFGTGNALLRYGIDTRCSKQPPVVRDAFSEALGVKNRLFWYGRDIRCTKTPFCGTRRISKARRTADSTDCGQPPAHRTHFQRRAVPKAASCRTGRIFSARNVPRSEVSRHKKETKVKDFDLFCRGTVTRTQDPLVPNQMR